MHTPMPAPTTGEPARWTSCPLAGSVWAAVAQDDPDPEPAPPGKPEPEPEPAVEPVQATATKPRPMPPKLDQLPPFRVLLHNDDHSSFDWMIDTIVELTPHRRESAMLLTWEAHATGVSLLLVTHKERAELYQDQFKTKKLIVTIEPAE